MDFGILGPLTARADGRHLALGGPKPRGLLAMLLLAANEPVARDRLIDGLWGERAPPRAGHNLDDYVSRLRRTLGPERIERRPPGYLLRVEPGELDLERFRRLVQDGRVQLAGGEAEEAAATLGAALAEWRGQALADLLYEPFAPVEAERLEAERLLAVEDRVEADLRCGDGPELVPELERLVRDHPLQERLTAQLMIALYRSGRQAAALERYRATTRHLAEELGLEPGPALRELERQILDHDPALGPASPRRARA